MIVSWGIFVLTGFRLGSREGHWSLSAGMRACFAPAELAEDEHVHSNWFRLALDRLNVGSRWPLGGSL